MAFSRLGWTGFVFLALGLCLWTSRAGAVPVVFDLRGAEGLAIDGGLSGSSTSAGGILATFTHNDPGAGLFNQTASAFGINAAAAGDDTDELDDGAGFAEAISIVFDQPVFFRGLSVSSFGATDRGQLSLNGGALTDTISATGAYGGALLGTLIPLGSDLSLAYDDALSGNGFSYDSFTVEVVPEPGSAALLALGALALAYLRARRSGSLSRP
jgi:hypothetical protein